MMHTETTQRKVVRRSTGFTLIEVLTVSAMLAVMTSLLVPAIQNTRNSARDIICRNNLKQLGLACHNYHDVYGAFPPGWISRRGKGEGHPSNGWQTSLLPYLDEANLYNTLNMGGCVYEPADNDMSPLKQSLAFYRCPFDSLEDTNPFRGDWGTSNYVGNHGPLPIARWSESDFWPGQVPTALNLPSREWKEVLGVFHQNTITKIGMITDGTSNSILVGERCVTGRGAIWPGPRSNFHESDIVADASHASRLNRSDMGFSSRHLEGVLYFLFSDGSVHRISEEIDSQPRGGDRPVGGVLQKLAGMNDGEVIKESFDVR